MCQQRKCHPDTDDLNLQSPQTMTLLQVQKWLQDRSSNLPLHLLQATKILLLRKSLHRSIMEWLNRVTTRELWDLTWRCTGLINRGLQLLERRGVEKIYILGILLLPIWAIDYLLIVILNWIWWGILGVMACIAANGAFRVTTGTTTSLDNVGEDLARTLEGASDGQPAMIEATADASPPDYSENVEALQTRA